MNNIKKKQAIIREPLSKQLHNAEFSAFQRYKQKAAGNLSMPAFLGYELTNLFLVNLGGSLGYLLRKTAYRYLLQQLCPGVIIGRGVVLRHPRCIRLGRKVAIDDNVLLDASGAGQEGLRLGNEVVVSRNCVVQCKTGPVVIEDRVDIGANTLITSASGIFVESSVLIAGHCYIGGSRYYTDQLQEPIMDQGWYSKGPIHIGQGSWLGAGVIVLDGVRIGRGCVVGAGSVVTKNLPDYVLAIGVPAKFEARK